MKTYWDYEVKERARMTGEEVKALLDAELMTKGVLKPKEPEYEKVEEIKVATKIFYICCGIVFEKIEQAEKFLELNPLDSASDWSLPNKIKYVNNFYNTSIEKIELSEEREVDVLRNQLKQNKSAQDVNDKKQSEYKKAMEQTEKILRGVWDDWYECKELEVKHKKTIDTFNEYLKMTENNKELAYQFLLKVFCKEDIEEAKKWFEIE